MLGTAGKGLEPPGYVHVMVKAKCNERWRTRGLGREKHRLTRVTVGWLVGCVQDYTLLMRAD